MKEIDRLISRAEGLITRLEALLPQAAQTPDWKASSAFIWRKRARGSELYAVKTLSPIRLVDIKHVDEQKARLVQNTRQFIAGLPANNVLMTGARGTGKSSLVKAILNEFATKSLRLIEVDKADLIDLPDIIDLVRERKERFILFSDDLSFEANEPGYKHLKAVLDGSVAVASDNVLIYATSNRRHLMPEYMSENLEYKHIDEEIHPGETTEEKVSLSERFGLWLSFYPFGQDEYLAIAEHWTRVLGGPINGEFREAALRWSLMRAARSGRVAMQFARDWSGKHAKARR